MPRSAESWTLTRWVFLRLLALVFLSAFLSLRVQMDALIGGGGLAPAAQTLATAHSRLHSWAFVKYPTLAWISASDGALRVFCDAGIALSVVLLLGAAEAPVVLALWALWLSFTTIGGFALDWACDQLLLETAFFAIFLSPFGREARGRAPARWAVFLMHLLLFRFVLMCGLSKILAELSVDTGSLRVVDDPSWLDLSALRYHLETQPLPGPLSWYANLLPAWTKQLATATVLVVELVVPFLVLMRGFPRRASFIPLVVLQLGIMAAGNYAWFNWLTVVLAVFTLDDAVWRRVLPAALQRRVPSPPSEAARGAPLLARPLGIGFAALAAVHSITPVYGAFPVVAKERREVVLEGSSDGVTWTPYEFRWKPGRIDRAPGYCAPHQPRVDWALTEVAYEPGHSRRWFRRLIERLLEGSPAVVGLLDGNPFPTAPPRMIRSVVFRYRYTTPEERAQTGAWWHRDLIGVHLEPVERRG